MAMADDNGVKITEINPRPFGYAIGDEITREIILDAPASYQLQRDSLRKPGRVDPWLELRSVEVEEKSTSATMHYRVKLRYQIMNSPAAVKTLALPKLLFLFNFLDKNIREEVGDTPFTVSPLTPAFVLARSGLEELQADRAAPLINATSHYVRLGFAAVLTAAGLLWLVAVQFGLPFFRKHNGPFARALRDIKSSSFSQEEKFRRLHRAFDETSGATVFPDKLADFFSRRSAFADLQTDAEKFFSASRAQFFSADKLGDAVSNEWLAAFCKQCRDRERGLR